MNYIEVEAGVGGLLTRTLRDRDVEKEATGKYSCRVLVSNTATAAPLHCQHETNGSETQSTYLCHVLVGDTNAAAPLHPAIIRPNPNSPQRLGAIHQMVASCLLVAILQVMENRPEPQCLSTNRSPGPGCLVPAISVNMHPIGFRSHKVLQE